MIAIVFWLLLALLAFVYVGFPCLVIIVGTLRPRRVARQPFTPSLSLIIAAYNEEHNIAERLDNALELDYPPAAREILVASDGSDDATEAIVASYAARAVRLLRLPRRGKIYALNAAVAQSTGEILVFSDANSIYDRQAMRELASNFSDPRVGGVAGRTLYTLRADGESSSLGENLYWKYDNWLKQHESRTGSIVSAHGGMYAIRRWLFPQLEDSAVTDDFAISTAVIQQGYRLVYESEATSHEVAVTTANHEFWRKVRIITQGMRALLLRRRLLNPLRYGFYSLVLFCHKVLRRLVPIVLLMLFVASAFASRSGRLYFCALVAQILFYSLAGAGYFLRRLRWGRLKLLYIPFFYCMANAAALVALVKLIKGRRIELWQPQRHET